MTRFTAPKSHPVASFAGPPGFRRVRSGKLGGSLAPEGALAVVAGEGGRVHLGPARVFEDEATAMRSVEQGEIEAGDIVVVRGMHAETSTVRRLIDLLAAHGLADDVPVVTDGVAGEIERGLLVSQVCPTAVGKGPIAAVRDGEPLRIDLNEGRIDRLDATFTRRRPSPYLSSTGAIAGEPQP